MSYSITQGGHAPGHLRDEFCETIEAIVHDRDRSPETLARLDTITGQLWNCGDALPSDVMYAISAFIEPDESKFGSYAGASRLIRRKLGHKTIKEMVAEMQPEIELDVQKIVDAIQVHIDRSVAQNVNAVLEALEEKSSSGRRR